MARRINEAERAALSRERRGFLRQLERTLETPMIVLAFVWLALLVVELIWGLSPLLEAVVTAIWLAFIVDFLLRLILAERRLTYLRRNWLTAISLAVPALRVLRPLRLLWLARGVRGVRLVKVVGSLNRGMGALRASLRRRGVSYLLALTALVLLVGAAGMYTFERSPAEGEGLNSYGEALWWTAMILTTLGSQYWPQTPEGRVLCVLLAAYSLGVLGYITATLASFFIGRDAANPGGEVASAEAIRQLRHEVRTLREEVHRLREERRL